MTWTPLLDTNQREGALAIVEAIATDLRARFSATADAALPEEAWSLARGRAGVALFFAYLGQALADTAAQAFAAQLIEAALDAAAGQVVLEPLFQGFSGVAWSLAHVDGWLFDLSDGDPVEAVDAALLDLVKTSPWDREYDLIAGLAGIGVYALERLPRPVAHELLAAVVARLAELAERDAPHPFWWTPPERLPAQISPHFPAGAWNLGTAHGAPGVVGLLGLAYSAGVTAAGPVLGRAVDWVLAQQATSDARASFPSFVGPDNVAAPSRLAWCYGDPGVAGSLLLAARQTGHRGWEAEALAIAERAAACPLARSDVVDAAFCHGSSGLAHIFTRLFQATHKPVFQAAAERWLGEVMQAWRPGEGLGGFVSDDGAGHLTPQPGLLTGAAGIGLVLLAAATPVTPRWDRLYLLS